LFATAFNSAAADQVTGLAIVGVAHAGLVVREIGARVLCLGALCA
jgi:hypothetical protein